MSAFWLLLKCDLLRLVKSGKNRGGKIAITAIVYLLLGALIIAMSALYTGLFGAILPSEHKYLALSLVFGVFTLILLMMTVGTSKILFGASDYDMLMSMPIKPQTVILSKLAYVYIVDFVATLLCVFPATIAFMVVSESGAIVLLNALLLVPFLPLVPLFIGLIFGTLFNILMAKVKRKNLVGLAFSGLFLIAYFILMFKTGSSSDMSDEDMALAISKIAPILLPFSFVVKGMLGNYLNILIFDLAVFVVVFLYVYILSKNYKKINGLITSKRTSANFTLEKQKSASITFALVKKEIKVYFSNSTIVLNTIIGPIMAILFAIILLVKGGIQGFISQMPEEMEGAEQIIAVFAKGALPYIPFFFVGLSTYASFSVSLEGKNLWLIKSLPISAKEWLNAKFILNLILILPAGIISVILFGIALNVTVLDVVIAIIIISLYSLLGTALGLTINLKFNSFDWSNPAEIVKRGASATIATFVGMFAVVPVVAVQILGSIISVYLGFALVTILLATLAILFYCLAYNKAEQKLKRL